jgi:hypothetical protein
MNNSDALRAALRRVESALSENFAGRVSSLEFTAQGKLGFGASYHPSRAQSRLNATELTAYLSKLMGW